MNYDQLLAFVKEKNPPMQGETVTLSSANLEKAFKLFWDRGYKEGVSKGTDAGLRAAKYVESTGKGSPGMDIFNEIFGNGFSKS